MYRQILVHEDDQDLQRILWRTTPAEPIQIYRLSTVTYGLTCAPYLAVRTVHQLGLDEGHRFPLAAEVIKHSIYVDDVLTGADNLEDATKLYDQLIKLFMAGGFPLRKWTTNCLELLKQIPEDLQALSSGLSWHSETSVSMLGLTWQPESDCFVFGINLSPVNDVITKRLVASRSAQLFDPLGWLSPVVVVTKIFLQGLWKLKISWDDPLPEEFCQRWRRYYEDLQHLSLVRVHRWIGVRSTGCSHELHGFGDASERAYATVVYLKTIQTTGDCSVVLLSSKTKVAPVKSVVLPRLELCAAVLLARLVSYIQSILKLDASLHMWSDSTTALAWIADSPSKRKTYVANRVSEIQTTLPSAVWHHVSDKDNPADCASRGISAREFSFFSLWWNGPEWLPNPDDWPSGPTEVPDCSVDMEERATVNLVVREKKHWYLFRRYSSLDKLLRVTAWCFRFYNAVRLRSMISSPHITAPELRQARLRLIQHEQLRAFSEEIAALKKKHNIPKRSHLLKFNPFLDGELLRVGGRLKHSLLSFDEKHPLLLPSDSILTKLMIEDCHRRCLHGGTQLTLGTLRQSYWILRGRSLVRSVIHRCVPCVKNRAAIPQQLMADLPAFRSTSSIRPFLNTGVDYAGPIKLRTHKGRGFKSYKGYICIFVCCATRAVHLEVVSDYMASGFIAAYRRFSSRRGICKTLVSDNAKNFVGADRQLKQMFSEASEESEAIASILAADGTEWKFNPPAGSHFGGLYEAAVKSTKFHLKRTIGETLLTFEEMTTFLTQVEACLNSWPLMAESDDPQDLSALTPGHFLTGSPLNAVPEPSLIEIAQNRLSRWQLLQQMRQHFWKRWSSEYLKELQPRSKWRTLQPSIQLGDLVLIREENLPPTKWAMGRVIKLHHGNDSLIRVVTLKTQRDSVTRPIVKLCLLPRATCDTNDIVQK